MVVCIYVTILCRNSNFEAESNFDITCHILMFYVKFLCFTISFDIIGQILKSNINLITHYLVEDGVFELNPVSLIAWVLAVPWASLWWNFCLFRLFLIEDIKFWRLTSKFDARGKKNWCMTSKFDNGHQN